VIKFWDDLRSQVQKHTTAGDITVEIYRKLATSGANQLAIIKPAYYLGQLSIQTHDFMDMVEKILQVKEGELGAYLRLVLYLRESARNLYGSIREISSPLEDLILEFEELFEGEELEEEAELGEAEPEEGEPVPPSADEEDDDEEFDQEESSRDLLLEKREELEEALRVKLRDTGCSARVVEELANRLSLVYLECVQLAWDLGRFNSSHEGDIVNLLSTLIDIQYGLDFQLRQLIWEDLVLDPETTFRPGLLTWAAHFVADCMEKIGADG